MLPANTEPVPSVAELPTCQNTLHSWAPLISDTVLAEPVISVESVWKMNTELGSPSPSSTSVPVKLSGDLLGPGVHAADEGEAGEVGGRGGVQRASGGVQVGGRQVELGLRGGRRRSRR